MLTTRYTSRRVRSWLLVLLCIWSVLVGTTPGLANPLNGTVVGGSATINQSGNTVMIQQTTPRAVINWQSFSIAQGELTQFYQPSSSAAVLNRVTGGNPSALYGSLRANGQVYLINPNGILVGPGATINVGGLVASTLDVPNAQFMKGGTLDFEGSSRAGVANYGTIRAIGGDIFLIGATVENHGLLEARNGTVGLAAGQSVRLAEAGNPRLVVRATSDSIGGTGVLNRGLIEALQAELIANGGNVYALAINNEGIVRATGSEEVGGRIFLVSEGGQIRSSGDLIAKRGDNGGDVILYAGGTEGSSVTVTGTVDVSGTARGGNVGIKAATIDVGLANIVLNGQQPGSFLFSLGPHSIVSAELKNGGPLQWKQEGTSITDKSGLITMTDTVVLDGNGATVSSKDGTPFQGLTIQSADQMNNPYLTRLQVNLDEQGSGGGQYKNGSTITFEFWVLEPDGHDAMHTVTLPLKQAGQQANTKFAFEATNGELIHWVRVTSAGPDGKPVVNAIKQVNDTDVAAGVGVLIVEKQTLPADSPQQFSFKLSGTGSSSFVKDFLLKDNDSNTTYLLPGIYEVAETLPLSGAWFLDSISIVENKGANSSANVANAKATIGIETNETIHVTFTNVEFGKIIVEKQVVTTTPDGTAFTFTPSYGSPFSLQGGDSNTSGYLNPGQYSVTESVPEGWVLTGINGVTPSSETANVALQPGQTVTVTFTNTEQGRIVVAKQIVTTTSDNPAFAFTSSYGSPFSLQGGGSNTSGYLNPGDYSVTEAAVKGWTLSGITGAVRDGMTSNIHLLPGQEVSVTFTNTQNVTPPTTTFGFLGFRWDPIYPDGVGTGLGYYGAGDTPTQVGSSERIVVRRPVLNEQGEEVMNEVPIVLLNAIRDSSYNVYQPLP